MVSLDNAELMMIVFRDLRERQGKCSMGIQQSNRGIVILSTSLLRSVERIPDGRPRDERPLYVRGLSNTWLSGRTLHCA